VRQVARAAEDHHRVGRRDDTGTLGDLEWVLADVAHCCVLVFAGCMGCPPNSLRSAAMTLAA
jgi:hypothetical protein